VLGTCPFAASCTSHPCTTFPEAPLWLPRLLCRSTYAALSPFWNGPMPASFHKLPSTPCRCLPPVPGGALSECFGGGDHCIFTVDTCTLSWPAYGRKCLSIHAAQAECAKSGSDHKRARLNFVVMPESAHWCRHLGVRGVFVVDDVARSRCSLCRPRQVLHMAKHSPQTLLSPVGSS